jgi:myo-inositol-1(or 4)-monophosphatase
LAASRAELEQLKVPVAAIIREAGEAALGFARAGAKRWTKGDNSVVTEADLFIDGFLHERLLALDADIGWLSEETVDTPERLNHERVWIVDPIDGTRAFVEGVPVWVISVALVEHGRPVFGMIYNPTKNEMFEAIEGGGAFLNGRPITASPRLLLEGAEIVGPRAMMEDLDGIGAAIARAPYVYALAYRLASVAANRVDAAVASTRAKDWDIAAADIIMREAGAVLLEIDGEPPRYNLPAPVHRPLIGAREPLNGAIRSALLLAGATPRSWAG